MDSMSSQSRGSHGRDNGPRRADESRRFVLAVAPGSAMDSRAMAGEPHESIWIKLAKLDLCCDVDIRSLYVRADGGPPHREWEVEIRHRDPKGLVRVRDLVLVEAVQRALIQAEVRGWPGAALRTDAPAAGRGQAQRLRRARPESPSCGAEIRKCDGREGVPHPAPFPRLHSLHNTCRFDSSAPPPLATGTM